jgi:hypothetical protein
MFLVLLGAALHATWNVIIKAGSDKQLDTCRSSVGRPGSLRRSLYSPSGEGQLALPWPGGHSFLHPGCAGMSDR